MMRRCMGCMEEIEENLEVCPLCDYRMDTPPREPYHMVEGTILHARYIIGKVLGYGGFGVTYIGYDASLDRKVAVKEFLPSTFATRMPGNTQITVYGGEATQQFEAGLDRFVDEARRLAGFNGIPGIVDIYDTFVENNTAYIVMEYLQGVDVKELLQANGVMPFEDAKEIILKICDTLKPVHQAGVIHRDISPDNIYVTRDGKIKLLDFGASRYATSVNSKSLSVILKSGYAPEEQYRSKGDQGPWSDVYALAATFYKMITGITPDDSMERAIHDELKEPSQFGVNLTQASENAIMNALNIKKEFRTQTVEEFESALLGEKVGRVKDKKTKQDVGHLSPKGKVMIAALLSTVLIMGLLTATGTIGGNNYLKDSFGSAVPEGYVNTPGVVNLSEKKAMNAVDKAKLEYLIIGKEYSDQIEKGRVLTQEPLPGRVIRIGETLQVLISGGNKQEAMQKGELVLPDLTYMTIQQAIFELEECGYSYDVEYEFSDTVAEGLVIKTEGNTFYSRVSVSKGKATNSKEIRAAFIGTRSDRLVLMAAIDQTEATNWEAGQADEQRYRVLSSTDQGKTWQKLQGENNTYINATEWIGENGIFEGSLVEISLDHLIGIKNQTYLNQDLMVKLERYRYDQREGEDSQQNENGMFLWGETILEEKFLVTRKENQIIVDEIETLSWEEIEKLAKTGEINEENQILRYEKEDHNQYEVIRLRGNFESGGEYRLANDEYNMGTSRNTLYCYEDGYLYDLVYIDYEGYVKKECRMLLLAEVISPKIEKEKIMTAVSTPYISVLGKEGEEVLDVRGMPEQQALNEIIAYTGITPSYRNAGYEYSNYPEGTISIFFFQQYDNGQSELTTYTSLGTSELTGDLEKTEQTQQSPYGKIKMAALKHSTNYAPKIEIIVDGITTKEEDTTTYFKLLYSTNQGKQWDILKNKEQDGEEYEITFGHYKMTGESQNGIMTYEINLGKDFMIDHPELVNLKTQFKVERYISGNFDGEYLDDKLEEVEIKEAFTFLYEGEVRIDMNEEITREEALSLNIANENEDYYIFYRLKGSFQEGDSYYYLPKNTVDTSEYITCKETGVLYLRVYDTKEEEYMREELTQVLVQSRSITQSEQDGIIMKMTNPVYISLE